MRTTSIVKNSPYSSLLQIVFCLSLFLFAVTNLSEIKAYDVEPSLEVYSTVKITTTPLASHQDLSIPPSSPFLLHVFWFGIVLSICILIGIHALVRKYKTDFKPLKNLHHMKSVPNHIPLHG